MIKSEQGSALGGIYRFCCKATADTIGSCPINRNIRTIMGSWKYIWRNWDRSHHNNRSMREQRSKFSTNWTSPDHMVSCNLPLAKKRFFWMNNDEHVGEDKPTKWLQRGRNMLSMKTRFSFIQEPLDEKTYLDSKQFFSQRGYACNETRLVC